MVAVTTPIIYPVIDDTWKWQPPKCDICGKEAITYYTPPPPSELQDLVICGRCHLKHLDDVIRKAKNAPQEE